MQRLFLAPQQFEIGEERAHILGADHLHLARVLRAKPGDRLLLLDNEGNGWEATLTEIGKTESAARLDRPAELPPEPPIELNIAQALGKGDKFEQVVQHGTEVGARSFMPLLTQRCVVQIPESKRAERLLRWRQIARGAAEQAFRARKPDVYPITEFMSLVQNFDRQGTLPLLLHPTPEAASLRAVLESRERPVRILLCIGPEGGWSPQEVSAAQAANIPIVTLGPSVLRTQTAALVAISQILYHFEIKTN